MLILSQQMNFLAIISSNFWRLCSVSLLVLRRPDQTTRSWDLLQWWTKAGFGFTLCLGFILLFPLILFAGNCWWFQPLPSVRLVLPSLVAETLPDWGQRGPGHAPLNGQRWRSGHSMNHIAGRNRLSFQQHDTYSILCPNYNIWGLLHEIDLFSD